MQKVFNFPTFPISKQLFHVPGMSIEGGFTSGGARISSPEPGGRAMLEIQPSLQINEWAFPLSSWIMSKINGQVFRVRLAPTPQVLSSRRAKALWQPGVTFDDRSKWAGDLTGVYVAAALEGTTFLTFTMGEGIDEFYPGHVIGHADNCYMADEVERVNDTTLRVTVTPPLRKNVAIGDQALFRPYFLGTIFNGSEIRTTYDASNNGAIQLNRILFQEVIQ